MAGISGFLAGYSGLTRVAYELDLRQHASWCRQHHLQLFQARAPASNASPAAWKPAAAPVPPSPADPAARFGLLVLAGRPGFLLARYEAGGSP
jgi:hypothetical protein